jgi:hypothetical protein
MYHYSDVRIETAARPSESVRSRNPWSKNPPAHLHLSKLPRVVSRNSIHHLPPHVALGAPHRELPALRRKVPSAVSKLNRPRRRCRSPVIPHPSSLILHPSSFQNHPSRSLKIQLQRRSHNESSLRGEWPAQDSSRKVNRENITTSSSCAFCAFSRLSIFPLRLNATPKIKGRIRPLIRQSLHQRKIKLQICSLIPRNSELSDKSDKSAIPPPKDQRTNSSLLMQVAKFPQGKRQICLLPHHDRSNWTPLSKAKPACCRAFGPWRLTAAPAPRCS